MTRRRIDWASAGLGQRPDEVIAAELGVHIVTVRKRRWLLCIPKFEPIDWDAQPFGQVSDGCLADALSLETGLRVTDDMVRYQRIRRGISGFRQYCIDWATQPLGDEPDGQLARRLGVTVGAVAYQRRSRGLPSWRERRGA